MELGELVPLAAARAVVRLPDGRTGRLVFVQTERCRPRRCAVGKAVVELRPGVHVTVRAEDLEVVGT